MYRNYEIINKVLTKQGFERSKEDACVYGFKNDPKQCTVLIYVDDILINVEDESLIERLIEHLATEFKIKDLGEVPKFVGLEIQQNREMTKTFIFQRKYICDVLAMHGMSDCNLVKVPMKPGLKIVDQKFNIEYRTIVRSLLGALSYISRGSRLD